MPGRGIRPGPIRKKVDAIPKFTIQEKQKEVKERAEGFFSRKFNIPVEITDEAANAITQRMYLGGEIWLEGREQPGIRLEVRISPESKLPINSGEL